MIRGNKIELKRMVSDSLFAVRNTFFKDLENE
jgi:hypothetical protein